MSSSFPEAWITWSAISIIALMNPEDKKNIQDFQSFSDRIAYINIPYVLDLQTEVNIYRNIFGKHIDECFLPRVLHNFARVIISSTCSKEDNLINMNALYNYFTNVRKDLARSIPSGFLDSLLHMYNYTVLQEVKELLYYFNEEQISKDIQNYMFAVNFELDTTEICTYTGERIEITEDFFRSIENHLLGVKIVQARRLSFRKDVQKEYTSRTLTQEILMEGKSIHETSLFDSLRERYVFNLKEKALDPFMNNKNFRMAIKDYGSDDFKTYDKRIRNDVSFLVANLCNKYRYTQQGAKEVCIHVIDNDLPQKFAASS